MLITCALSQQFMSSGYVLLFLVLHLFHPLFLYAIEKIGEVLLWPLALEQLPMKGPAEVKVQDPV